MKQNNEATQSKDFNEKPYPRKKCSKPKLKEAEKREAKKEQKQTAGNLRHLYTDSRLTF